MIEYLPFLSCSCIPWCLVGRAKWFSCARSDTVVALWNSQHSGTAVFEHTLPWRYQSSVVDTLCISSWTGKLYQAAEPVAGVPLHQPQLCTQVAENLCSITYTDFRYNLIFYKDLLLEYIGNFWVGVYFFVREEKGQKEGCRLPCPRRWSYSLSRKPESLALTLT